jgi:hypothetical protein
MRLAFWFQKFSRDELRRSPQAIANRGRWKNGDRQRSFRSAVSRGPRVVLRAEIRSLSPHFQLGEGGSAGRQRSFRSEGVSWSPCGFCVRKFEACHHISSWAKGVPRVDL